MLDIVTVTGFSQDESGDWVMHLSCGHRQHARHKPPFQQRPWVLTEQGRRSRLGAKLHCTQCEKNMPFPSAH